MDDLIIDEEHIQLVESFRCLCSVMNKENPVKEEIKERIVMGN
jgi:hypothetical protein